MHFLLFTPLFFNFQLSTFNFLCTFAVLNRPTMIAIYTLTSELHNVQAIDAATRSFLDSLHLDHQFCGSDYSTYGRHSLDLIYVRTGGTNLRYKQFPGRIDGDSIIPATARHAGRDPARQCRLHQRSHPASSDTPPTGSSPVTSRQKLYVRAWALSS